MNNSTSWKLYSNKDSVFIRDKKQSSSQQNFDEPYYGACIDLPTWALFLCYLVLFSSNLPVESKCWSCSFKHSHDKRDYDLTEYIATSIFVLRSRSFLVCQLWFELYFHLIWGTNAKSEWGVIYFWRKCLLLQGN